MRVAVVGGYGVFGSRLCELLRRDGHTIWVAGRDGRKAARVAARLDARPLTVSVPGDLDPLKDVAPDVVVDAAGPFQPAGHGPPPLAAFCVRNGINYVDLSDDADFTARVKSLDDAARAAGCFALSGASSVPGLSSAVVRELAQGMTRIECIDTAILPGNRAPRGRSVIAGILARMGTRLRVWRGAKWTTPRCWSDPRRYELAPGLRRRAFLIDVPDTALFPGHFGARSVTFRAGLELGVMNRSLGWIGALRRLGIRPESRLVVAVAHFLSSLLAPFGSDRGGMVVTVTGEADGTVLTRTWRLLAEAGHGPYVPVALVRALLRDPAAVPAGARACLADVPLASIIAAMDDLAVRTDRREAPARPLFERTLGEDWDRLPAPVQRLHRVFDREVFAGTASVTSGKGLAARLAALMFRFPPSGDGVPVRVVKQRMGDDETWERDFAGRRFRSRLSPGGAGECRERFGVFSFRLALPVEDGTLAYRVTGGRMLGLPLPKWLLPGSTTTDSGTDGAFRFDVRLTAPLTGALLVHYRGTLAPEGDGA